MEERKEHVLPRYTFEEVLQNQILLLKDIDTFIGENRGIKPGELVRFTLTYSRATLGIGRFTLFGRWVGTEDINIDYLIFTHLVHDDGIVVGWDYGEQTKKEPRAVWSAVKEILLGDIFGRAKQQALTLSPEKDHGMVEAGLRGTRIS